MVLLKYIRERNQSLRTSFRSFSLNTLESSKTETSLSASSRRANKIYDYMKSYEAGHLFKKIPSQYFKNKFGNRYLLINPFVAKKITSALKLYLSESYVLESDPGFGLLSKEIFPVVSYLRLYEEDVLLRSDLRYLQENHPTKVEIFERSLRAVHKFQLEDSLDNGNRLAQLVDGIPIGVKLSIIVTIPSKTHISAWMRHVLRKNYFSNFPRLDFYFFISPSVFTRLTASPQNDYFPRYQKFSVLAQILFDIKLLMNDIPRKAFLPWPSGPKRSQTKRDVEKYENDQEFIYLVKMSLKTENLPFLQDESLNQCFFTFVSQNMRGKKRIVPYFESIIPGSGAKVIMMGFNTFSTFNELSPDEIFALFFQLTKWPEFQNSSFYTYWKDQAMTDDNEPSMEEIANPLHSLEDALHDDDDNDDDTFLPGNKVK